MNIHLRDAEYDSAYKARVLKAMQENLAFGLDNSIYEETIVSFINNKASFVEVFSSTPRRFLG